MFTTSQHIDTISSSRICARIALASSSLNEPLASAASGVIFVVSSPTKIVRISAKLLTPVRRHQEIVFEAQPPAAFPVNARFNRPYHARLHCPGRGLVRVGRLMCASANSMPDRMRGLARVTRRVDSPANDSIDFAHSSALAHAGV